MFQKVAALCWGDRLQKFCGYCYTPAKPLPSASGTPTVGLCGVYMIWADKCVRLVSFFERTVTIGGIFLESKDLRRKPCNVTSELQRTRHRHWLCSLGATWIASHARHTWPRILYWLPCYFPSFSLTPLRCRRLPDILVISSLCY